METFERIARALEGIESALQVLADKHPKELDAEMIRRYGWFVDKSVAAEIIGVSRQTVYKMLADGRLTAACAGKRVDVRSIAEYLRRSSEHEKETEKQMKGET